VPGCAQFTAASGGPFPAGTAPRALVSGDFDGDGKLDLAIANSTANSVTVLLGNGAGGFAAAAGSPFAVGNAPQSLVTGDFNGDGKLDLAIVNFGDNTVTVMLGTGTGQFTAGPGSPIPVGTAPVFVASADFNGDNKADLIVANSGDNTLTVLFGDGAGFFTVAPASPIALAATPQSLALGDLNKDGNQDIVVVNSSARNVAILLGDGTGHFHAPAVATVAVGSLPLAAAVADMNGDGNMDILVANSGDNTVSELLGDGTGAFTVATGSPFSVGSKPSSLAVVDFNGDGLADIITANATNNNVTLLLGTTSGGFTPATSSPFAVGTGPTSIAIGDFNGDGKPDAAVANLASANVTLLLNSLPVITANPASLSFFAVAGHASPAALAVTTSSSTSGGAYTIAAAQPWLSSTPASNSTGGVTSVHLSANPASLGAGVYSATVRYKAPNFFDAATAVTLNVSNPTGTLTAAPGSPFSSGGGPQSVAVDDLNGDGKLDIVTANYAANTVTVLLGDGTGGFTQAAGSPFGTGTSPASVTIGDFNGDGKPDIVTANAVSNTVSLLLGNGSGSFSAAASFAVGSEPLSIAAFDMNRDGRLDLVTVNNSGNSVSVLLGNGAGGFAAALGSPFAAGVSPNSVAAGDFNGDGKPDLAVATAGNLVLIFLGNGVGGLSYNGFISVGSFPQAIAAQDFNGDGKVDLVTTNSGDNTVTVLLGNGLGGFAVAPSSPFTVGNSPEAIAVGDVNGDGKPDIVASNLSDGTVTILVGDGLGGFAPAAGSPFPAGTSPSALAFGDFNGDGSLDLAIANTGANGVTVLLGSPFPTTAALTTTAVSPIAHGSSATLTLTVAPTSGGFSSAAPTGTATFIDGATVLGNSKQTGSPYTFNAALSGGVHSLTAIYNGDTANAASTGGPLALTVLAQSQTITFAALPSKPFSAGTITVAATTSSGLAVTFGSTTPAVCSVSATL
jgi:FG-GAP-like repeat/Bacterial Ig-like domain (group 3)/FG-GAP repeat